jgi:hypothetical protein
VGGEFIDSFLDFMNPEFAAKTAVAYLRALKHSGTSTAVQE